MANESINNEIDKFKIFVFHIIAPKFLYQVGLKVIGGYTSTCTYKLCAILIHYSVYENYPYFPLFRGVLSLKGILFTSTVKYFVVLLVR